MTVIGGKLKCITEKYIPHYTRHIGSASTSDARPDWWCYPRRKRRGEVSGNMHTLAHAQFGSWACHYSRRFLTSQNEVKGDVPISVPAPCGSWRDAHLSAHAKYWSWSWRDVGQHEQLERWGQCKLRYPPTAKLKLKPGHRIQGGVVDWRPRFGECDPRLMHGVTQAVASRVHTINVAQSVSYCYQSKLHALSV